MKGLRSINGLAENKWFVVAMVQYIIDPMYIEDSMDLLVLSLLSPELSYQGQANVECGPD